MPGDEGIDEFVALLDEGVDGQRQVSPEPTSVFRGDGARCPAGLNVASEGAEDLPKRGVRVADTRVGIAGRGGNDQIGVCFLGPADEGADQSCLAAARVTSDETYPATTGKGKIKEMLELIQFAVAGDEDRVYDLGPLLLAKEGWRLNVRCEGKT
jgi:hypothetical protein